MHIGRASLDKEIVRQVVKYLAEHNDDVSTMRSRGYLRNAALVSKQFSLFALDYLWETMPALLPLLCILGTVVGQWIPGSDSWHLRKRESRLRPWENISLMDSKDPTTTAEVCRFKTYAARIRYLQAIDLASEGITVGLVAKLKQLLGGSPLLPALIKISWMLPPDRGRSSLAMEEDLFALMPTTLRYLCVRPSPCLPRAHQPISVNHVVHNLHLRVPHLETLDLGDVDVSQVTLKEIVRLPRLRHVWLTGLHCQPHAPFLMSLLSSLGHLSSSVLNVHWPPPPDGSLVTAPANLKPLGLLKQLRIEGYDIPLPALVYILAKYDRSSLTTLHLPSLKVPTTSWRALRQRLDVLATENLLDLELNMDFDVSTDYLDNLSFADVILPLLKLRRLRRIQLQVKANLNDRDMHLMAASWSELETIRLLTSPETVVSVTVLSHLARGCPYLKNIVLQGCSVLTPSADDVYATPEMHHGLSGDIAFEKLANRTGKDVDTADVERCYRYIARLYPCIAQVLFQNDVYAVQKVVQQASISRTDSVLSNSPGSSLFGQPHTPSDDQHLNM